jgi:hypothetical protein
MPLDSPPPLRDRLRSWYGRTSRPLRAALPYALIAAALLATSEILWLWHSWPVRQVLEGERLTAGASI